MSHPGNRIGLIFAVLGAVGFSFKAILIKLAYPYGVDAVTLLALRMGLSLPFFLALGWADQRRRQPAPLAGQAKLRAARQLPSRPSYFSPRTFS